MTLEITRNNITTLIEIEVVDFNKTVDEVTMWPYNNARATQNKFFGKKVKKYRENLSGELEDGCQFTLHTYPNSISPFPPID